MALAQMADKLKDCANNTERKKLGIKSKKRYTFLLILPLF